MNPPRRAGRVFQAIGFMVIGAVVTLLLTTAVDGSEPDVHGSAVDVGFSQDMIVHHDQAVTMAQAVRGRAGPSVSRLATSIELNQIREIGQMQGWLALWNAPQVASGPPMTWMKHAHGDPAEDDVMPGTASLREMDRLGELDGEKLEAWFLQLMIRHHQGGLIMAAAAARDTASPHVRRLATLMIAEQREESAVMTGLLAALGHRPLPAPSEQAG